MISPDNQITFCWKCHQIIENGRKNGEVWQSGRQFMIEVLNKLSGGVPFRWRAVRRWLITCEARHRVGDAA